MGLKALFDRVKQALTKTTQAIGDRFRALLGRPIDKAFIHEVGEILLSVDVGPDTVDRVSADLESAFRTKQVRDAAGAMAWLKSEFKRKLALTGDPIVFRPEGPTVALIVGVNGSGKTTSIAKLATYYKRQGKNVILAAGDTFRAAAIDQLGVWSQRVGVDLVRHQDGADPAAVVFDASDAAVARKADLLIIDTAGRLQTKENLMRELDKIRKVATRKIPGAPHESLLVLDATTGQNALSQAKHFSEVAGLTGIFLAKLDGTARGGVVLSIRDQLGLPVKFVGLGETPDDIELFDADTFVEALFSS